MTFVDPAPDFTISGIDMNTVRANGFAVDWSGGASNASQLVTFYWRDVPDPIKSRELGRQFNVRKIFIKIRQLGDSTTEIDREVKTGGPDDDRYRWPNQWNSFIKNKVHVPEGSPTSVLFPTNPEIVSNLHSWGIYTVEQLAAVNAHGIDTIGMGAQEWQNRAKRYLERAERGVSHHQFEEMKAAHAREVGALHNTINDLNVKLGQLMEIVRDQPGHVSRRIAETGIETPAGPVRRAAAPYSPPAAAPLHSAADIDALLEPVDAAAPSGRHQEWVEPPPGFFSEQQASPDPQADMIAANHQATEQAAQNKVRHGGWPKGVKRGPDGRPAR